MVKNAIRFWLYYKKQTFLVMSILLFSTVVILNVLLFLRGNRMTQYESALDSNGNYNYCFLDLEKKDVKELKQSNYFRQVGILYDEGQAGLNEENTVQLASADKTGLLLYHHRLRSGSYPERCDEIALSSDTCRKLGVASVIGETVRLNRYIEGVEAGEVTYTITGILNDIDRLWISSYSDPYPDAIVGSSNSDTILFGMGLDKRNISEEQLMIWLDKNDYHYEQTDGEKLVYAGTVGSNFVDNSGVQEAAAQYRNNDFETVFLLPLFGGVIAFLAFVALLYSLFAVVRRRKESMAFYCLIGMPRRLVKRNMLLEILALSLISFVIGCVLGTLIYIGVFKTLTEIFQIDMMSAFKANSAVKLVTLPPYQFTAIFMFCSIFLTTLWFSLDSKEISPIDAVKKCNEVRTRTTCKWIRRRQKKKKTFRILLALPLKQHAVHFLTLFLIVTTVYFSALLIYEKKSVATVEYKEELKDAKLGKFDYLAQREYTNGKGIMGVYATNRREAGYSSEDLAQLEQYAKHGMISKYIEIRSNKVLETNKEKGKRLGSSLQEYSTEQQKGIEKQVQKMLHYTGYSQEDYASMYNIPLVGIDSAEITLSQLQATLLAGEIDLEALAAGEEVLLVVDSADQDCVYQVGDTVHFTDTVIDKKSPAYDADFSSGQIPAGGQKFSYRVTGSNELQEGYAYGYRVDYSAVVGAVIVLNTMDGADNFYRSSGLLEGDFQFIAASETFSRWGLPDCNYNKVGVQLKNQSVMEKFERIWYGIYADSMDMEVQSTANIKENLLREELKYDIVLILFSLFLLAFGLLSIYHCMQLQIIEKKQQIGILRLLGAEQRAIERVYFCRYLKYILLTATFAWLPLFLNWLHKQYIIHISLKLVERNGLVQTEIKGADGSYIIFTDESMTPEHIRKYCDVIRDVGYDNWFYNLDNAVYDFDSDVVWWIYGAVVLLLGGIILFFILHIIRKFVTEDIVQDMSTEE